MSADENAQRIREASASMAHAVQALGEAMARLTEAAGHMGAAIARFKAEYESAVPSQAQITGGESDAQARR